MKIYTNVFELTKRASRQFKVPPFSDYKIGIKVVSAGVPVQGDITLKAAEAILNPDKDKINGFTLYTMKSGEVGATEFQVYVEGVESPMKLVQITSNASVFDTSEGGGGGSAAEEEYIAETYSTRVMYQDTDTRTYVMSSFVIEGECNAEDIPGNAARHPIREIYFGTGVSAIGDNCCEALPGLTYVHLPKSVKRIGDKAFSRSFLARLDWDQEDGEYSGAGPAGRTNQGQLSIGLSAFAGCENLGQLNLPYRNKLNIQPAAVEGCNFAVHSANMTFVSYPGVHFMGEFWQQGDPDDANRFNLSGAVNSEPDIDTNATIGYVQSQNFEKGMTTSDECFGWVPWLRACGWELSGDVTYCSHATSSAVLSTASKATMDWPGWYIRPASLQRCTIDLSVDSDVVWPATVNLINGGNSPLTADVFIDRTGQSMPYAQFVSSFTEPGTRKLWTLEEYAPNRVRARLEAVIEEAQS